MSIRSGTLTEAYFYILLSLKTPMHGYAIIQNVTSLSTGRLHLAPGTLYGALGALQDRGWITLVGAASRRKQYALTEEGADILNAEINRLKELLESVDVTLSGVVRSAEASSQPADSLTVAYDVQLLKNRKWVNLALLTARMLIDGSSHLLRFLI